MSDISMFVIIFSGIWTLIGAIFLIIGIAMYYNNKRKKVNCTSSTYGKVTDIVRHQSYDRDGGYSSNWHPIFEYNVGELKFIKESPYGSSQSKYAIGQNVEVYFNPENYNEYYIAGDTLPTKLAKIFIFVGIGAIVMAATVAMLIIYLFK